MGFLGDSLRGVAQRVDPDPSRILVGITAEGKDRAKQLAGAGMGRTQVGIILSYLDEYSPQSVAEIANNCQLNWQIVKRTVAAYPTYFQVRM
jgi:hypothetical protein